MEQATATTTTDTFAHAHHVAGLVVAELGVDQLPFAVELEEDFPAGWRIHLKFRETRARGLLAFASAFDVPITRADTAFGIHLDAFMRVEDVEVRGSALVSPDTAARLTGEPTPVRPAPEVKAVQPVPLGDSVRVAVPAVTPVTAADGVE